MGIQAKKGASEERDRKPDRTCFFQRCAQNQPCPTIAPSHHLHLPFASLLNTPSISPSSLGIPVATVTSSPLHNLDSKTQFCPLYPFFLGARVLEFPGCPMVRPLFSIAGGTGSIPDRELRPCMPCALARKKKKKKSLCTQVCAHVQESEKEKLWP